MVGEKERADRLVNVRTRDNKVHGMHPIDDVIKQLVSERDTRSLIPCFGKDAGTITAVAHSNAAEPPENPSEGMIA